MGQSFKKNESISIISRSIGKNIKRYIFFREQIEKMKNEALSTIMTYDNSWW